MTNADTDAMAVQAPESVQTLTRSVVDICAIWPSHSRRSRICSDTSGLRRRSLRSPSTDLVGPDVAWLTDIRCSSDIPLWTPDGWRLVYPSNASPTRLLSVSSSAISDDTPQPVSPMGHYHPHGWSTDGRELIAVLKMKKRL